MATTRLALTLPVRLTADVGVKANFHQEPSIELHHSANKIGFTRLGYPDERLGKLGALRELGELAEQHKNSVYRAEYVGPDAVFDIIGDLLTHARAYVPDAISAALISGPRVFAYGAGNIVALRDEYVIWVPVTVSVVS